MSKDIETKIDLKNQEADARMHYGVKSQKDIINQNSKEIDEKIDTIIKIRNEYKNQVKGTKKNQRTNKEVLFVNVLDYIKSELRYASEKSKKSVETSLNLSSERFVTRTDKKHIKAYKKDLKQLQKDALKAQKESLNARLNFGKRKRVKDYIEANKSGVMLFVESINNQRVKEGSVRVIPEGVVKEGVKNVLSSQNSTLTI